MIKYFCSMVCVAMLCVGMFAQEADANTDAQNPDANADTQEQSSSVNIDDLDADTQELLKGEPDYTGVQILEGKVTSNYLKKVGKITIEYMPAYNEARFIYSCPSPLYDEKNAIPAVKESIVNFYKEKGYYTYTYLKPSLTSSDGKTNTTTHTAFVKLIK